MSKHDFPAEEFRERRALLREAMGRRGLDWLLALHPASLHWLTGAEAKGYQAFQCLLIGGESERVVAFTRRSERNEWQDDALVDEIHAWRDAEGEDPIEAFAALAAELQLRKARIGMEVPAFYLHPHHYLRLKAMLGEALVAEPTALIHDLRLVKSPREIAFIREASRIADLSIGAFRDALAIGRSELEIAADIYRALLSAGAGLPASPLNLVSGPRAGFSHGAPTERRLQPGDFGSVEYGVPYRRHTVSVGRQFSMGPPSRRNQELFDSVRRAADACIAAIRDGVAATVPHEAARRVIAEAGLNPHRIHTSGYGIAPAFPPISGEMIHMLGGGNYVLKAGMVLSVCPPVFIAEEQVGARLVDTVLVTETGAEMLTQSARDLIIIR